MRFFAIGRHGEEAGDILTEKGKAQVRRIAAELKSRLGNASIAIVSSTAKRCRETAGILLAELPNAISKDYRVLSTDMLVRDPVELAQPVWEHEKTYDAVIVITHGSKIKQIVGEVMLGLRQYDAKIDEESHGLHFFDLGTGIKAEHTLLE